MTTAIEQLHEVNPLTGLLRHGTERRERSLLALGVSVVIHVAIGASIVAASWALVSPPPIRTIKVFAPTLAPPSSGPPIIKGNPHVERKPQPVEKPQTVAKMIAPSKVPLSVPQPETPAGPVASDPSDRFGSETGDENGSELGFEGGNDPNGIGTGPGVDGGLGPATDTPVVIPWEKAKLLKRVEPHYPRVMIATSKQGLVVLEAVIDTTGHVEELSVLRSAPGSDQAAMDAVRQWEFEPAVVAGRAVRMRLTVTVNFALER